MTKVFFCRRCLPIKEGLLITMGYKKSEGEFNITARKQGAQIQSLCIFHPAVYAVVFQTYLQSPHTCWLSWQGYYSTGWFNPKMHSRAAF